MEIIGTNGPNYLVGTNEADRIFGLGADDTLVGSPADDLLDGGEGFDVADYRLREGPIIGNLVTGRTIKSDGTDTLVNIESIWGTPLDDILTGGTDDWLFGNAGNDTITGADSTWAAYFFATGAVQVDLALGRATGADGNDTLININRVRGSNFDDILLGNNNNNWIRGGRGNDHIDGRGGDNNVADYRSASGPVTVSLFTGTSTGADGNDTLLNIQTIRGSNFNDLLITSHEDFNQLRGMLGNDTLVGGSGYDIAQYNNAPGSVVVDLFAGTSSGADGNDLLIDINAVIGSQFDDTLRGDNANNYFNPLNGNDTIDGRGGRDIIGYLGFESAVTVNLALGFAVAENKLDKLINIESVWGTQFADRLTGNESNNFFRGYGGNDTIDGAGGLDFSAYTTGVFGDYRVQLGTENVLVIDLFPDRNGIDTLINIERLIFTDTNLALDIDGVAGRAYRIYEAAFNRTPDPVGLGFWIEKMDDGASVAQVSQGFINSAEFQAMYGPDLSNDQFILLLYENVLNRAPDQAGYDYWNFVMAQGVSRADVLAYFSESPENIAKVAPLIVNGILYIPYDGDVAIASLQAWFAELAGEEPKVEDSSFLVNSDHYSSFYGDTLSSQEFVNLLYDHVLNREPDAVGFQHWLDALSDGLGQDDVLEYFNISPEHRTNLALIQLESSGLPLLQPADLAVDLF